MSDRFQDPLVGILHPNLEPPVLSKTMALMAPAMGLRVVYMNPRDVDIENGTVKGRMLEGMTWTRTRTRVPDIVEVSPYCLRHTELIEFLEGKAYLTDDARHRLNKESLQRRLAADEYFCRYALRTERIESEEGLARFVDEQGEVVVKPVYSQRGVGVYRISRVGEQYRVGLRTDESLLDRAGLLALAEESFLERRHIAQEYVASRSKAGDPFDCRVHVEKDGRGNWRVARMFVRVGIGQQVISNVNQGGGLADVEPFLKANRPDDWEEVIAALEELAGTLPYRVEGWRHRRLQSLGCDVGVKRDGSLRVFELNRAPFCDSHKAEVAMLRVASYRWLYSEVVLGGRRFKPRSPWKNAQ